MTLPSEQYVSGQYLEKNPTWDVEDSEWKANQVFKMLERHKLHLSEFVEVGCGAGAVLAELSRKYPLASFVGYDIAPDAARFWSAYASQNISFFTGDFQKQNDRHFDVLLLLDVIEHVENPFSFLAALHGCADHFIFIIPLDLSAFSVLRESPLLYARSKTGHIHYFTKGLAVSLLEECGFEVIESIYTDAAFTTPNMTWRTKLAMLPRYLVKMINRDMGVRLLGGESLMVLAKSRVKKKQAATLSETVSNVGVF
jgi:SAM-dependent methyltransferase